MVNSINSQIVPPLEPTITTNPFDKPTSNNIQMISYHSLKEYHKSSNHPKI
jgi:hypothetical protein